MKSDLVEKMKNEVTNQNVHVGCANTAVFVVSNTNKPLMPTTPKRARELLRDKKADVYRNNPFTIRMLNRKEGTLQKVELKYDPGSKTTGIAIIVQGEKRGWFGISAWELNHRGHHVVKKMLSRSQLRRSRRKRKTRYRIARFQNRKRSLGWLAPSLNSRINNIKFFSQKILYICPINKIIVEQVKFDTQSVKETLGSKMETLNGVGLREYLLKKWNRSCTYCGISVSGLQIDHIVPKSHGGSDRISNFCLACKKCNQNKGDKSIKEFLKDKPLQLKMLLSQTEKPLRDTAAVNITRQAIVMVLKKLSVEIVVGNGAQTKINRVNQKYNKSHWIDAVCVGDTGVMVDVSRIKRITFIKAKGRGSRQMCAVDKYGFPRTSSKVVKRIKGFQSGDQVQLKQPKGKYKGVYFGTVAIRSTGRFDIKTKNGLNITSSYKNFKSIQKFDGYEYGHISVDIVEILNKKEL